MEKEKKTQVVHNEMLKKQKLKPDKRQVVKE
jgi:hypothetical protein